MEKRIKILFYLIFIFSIIQIGIFIFNRFYDSIYPGVYCANGVNLGGLKIERAEEIIKGLVEGIERQGFTFRAETEIGERQVSVPSKIIALTDPDLSRQIIRFDIQKTLEKAIKSGRQGTFVQKIGEIYFNLRKTKKIYLVYEIDREELVKILEQNFRDLEKPEKNANVEIVDNELVLKEEEKGFVLNYRAAIENLEENLRNFENSEINVPVILKEPGVKKEEIVEAFKQSEDLFNFAPYIIKYQNKTWTIPASLIGQWFEFEKEEFGKIFLKLNQNKILEFLRGIAKEIDVEPVKPEFKIEGERVVAFKTGEPGYALNKKQSAEAIDKAIFQKKRETTLIVDKIEPVLLEEADKMGIKELVGQGVSNFAGSPKNRRMNIKIGAEKINGLLIKPDQEFSLIEAIGPTDEEAGFFPELVIKGNRTVPEYGGGLCQIGTTMFRLALNAGLPITERTSHSYRVVYYEPAGTDATIYNPQPDLKFINDTGHYLLLQTEIDGDNLIFKFYGTGDGRKVESTAPKIFNIKDPGPPRFIETTELLPGEKKKIESAHPGADAEFKNIITFPNGIVREEIWRSHYRPWPEVWLVGKEIEKIEDGSAEQKQKNVETQE